MANDFHRAWALLFARLVLGLIFFMAGVSKVFQLGPLEHARKYFLPFEDTFLPVWSLWLVGVVVPLLELIAGALLILGLRTRDALIALGFVLVIVTFGHLLREPLYNLTGHVIPRLALLVICALVSARTRSLFLRLSSGATEGGTIRSGQLIRPPGDFPLFLLGKF
ncbi:MAG TPA: DoxX family protein [Chthoniobacterales bacterium]|nr:DoxX family protein [Chthoniobacterales bacterium]